MNDQPEFDLFHSSVSILKELFRGGGSLTPTAIADQTGSSAFVNASMLQIQSLWTGRDFVITKLDGEQSLDCGEPVSTMRPGWSISFGGWSASGLGRFDLGFAMARIQCMFFLSILLHRIKWHCILKAWT